MNTTTTTATQVDSYEAAYEAYLVASAKCAAAFAPLRKTTMSPCIADCGDAARPGRDTCSPGCWSVDNTRAWTHPGTGQIRYYVDIKAVLRIIGLEISYYKTGNIASACLRGDDLSNGKAAKICRMINSAKIWIDPEGTVHYHRVSDSDITLDDVINALKTAI